MEERSLPPHHIINSYLTRTICVQAGESSDTLRETEGGGEQWRSRRRDLSSWLMTVFFIFFALSRQTSSLKSETAEVAWLAEHLPLFAVLFFRSFSQYTFSRLELILHQRPSKPETLLLQHSGWWVKCFVISDSLSWKGIKQEALRLPGIMWAHMSVFVTASWCLQAQS